MATIHAGRPAASASLAVVVGLLAMTLSTAAWTQPGPTGAAVSTEPTPAAVEVSRTPYQQYVVNLSCGFGQTCTNNFAKVPASSRLEVANVSCYIELLTPVSGTPVLLPPQLLVLGPTGAIVSASTLAAVANVEAAPGIWVLNHAVSVFAAARQNFQIQVGLSRAEDKIIFLGCHISGQMVTLQ